MNSRKYARNTLKAMLALCAGCLCYFLSVGPAILLMLQTESESTGRGVEVYLLPFMELDCRVSVTSQGESLVSKRPAMFDLLLTSYLELYGDDVSLVYEFMLLEHRIKSGRFPPAYGCFF